MQLKFSNLHGYSLVYLTSEKLGYQNFGLDIFEHEKFGHEIQTYLGDEKFGHTFFEIR